MYFKQILEIVMLFIWLMFRFESIRQSSASHKCDILATFCKAIQISWGFVDLPQYFSILNAIITIFEMFFPSQRLSFWSSFMLLNYAWWLFVWIQINIIKLQTKTILFSRKWMFIDWETYICCFFFFFHNVPRTLLNPKTGWQYYLIFFTRAHTHTHTHTHTHVP